MKTRQSNQIDQNLSQSECDDFARRHRRHASDFKEPEPTIQLKNPRMVVEDPETSRCKPLPQVDHGSFLSLSIFSSIFQSLVRRSFSRRCRFSFLPGMIHSCANHFVDLDVEIAAARLAEQPSKVAAGSLNRNRRQKPMARFWLTDALIILWLNKTRSRLNLVVRESGPNSKHRDIVENKLSFT